MRQLKKWYSSQPPTACGEDLNSRLYCLLYVLRAEGAPVKGFPDLRMYDDAVAVGSAVNMPYGTVRRVLADLRREGIIQSVKLEGKYYIKF